jgi:hypothetical protein
MGDFDDYSCFSYGGYSSSNRSYNRGSSYNGSYSGNSGYSGNLPPRLRAFGTRPLRPFSTPTIRNVNGTRAYGNIRPKVEVLPIVHSNNISFTCTGTSVDTSWEKSENEFKSSVIVLSGTYDFDSKILNFSAKPASYSQKISIDYIKVTCNGHVFEYSESSGLIKIDLKNRHVFDTSFKLKLRYKLVDHRGTAKLLSSYEFKVIRREMC